jgi:hypothetical protein
VIAINTARSMLDRGYVLAAYCSHCERWAVLDLARLIADGRGDEPLIGRHARCSVCGERGMWQLRPPVYRDAVAGVGYVGYR